MDDDNIIRSGLEYQPKDILNIIISNLDLLDQLKLSVTSKKIFNKIKIKYVIDNDKIYNVNHLTLLTTLDASGESGITQNGISKLQNLISLKVYDNHNFS